MLDNRNGIQTDEMSAANSATKAQDRESIAGSIIAIGLSNDQNEDLEQFLAVTQPGLVVLGASHLDEQLLNFLFAIKSSIVLIHIKERSARAANLINQLVFATRVILTSPAVFLLLQDLHLVSIPYLQMPHSFENFHQEMDGFRDNAKVSQEITDGYLDEAFKVSAYKRISAREKKIKVTVKIADITHVALLASGALIYTKDGRKLSAHNNDELINTVQTSRFVQVTRTRYVNLRHVQKVIKKSTGSIALKLRYPHQEVSVTKFRADLVKKLLCTLSA